MKNVLVLGAGLVARPLLRYLLAHYEHRVLVATLDVPRAQILMGEHPRGSIIHHDVSDIQKTTPLLAESDVVVSLLPAELNVPIAKLAISLRKPMINTSYASPEMWALDEEARRGGVLILNEIGLDPGIDHMSAVAKVKEIKFGGGKVTSFLSCCGGFPAQDANTNPWGYKFSWNPRGVLKAGLQPARYLRSNEAVEIDGGGIVFDYCWPLEFPELGVFEIYPNRDSLKYVSLYHLEGVNGMFRGTLRYPGWCATMRAIRDLGLFDAEEVEWPEGTTYRDVATRKLQGNGGHLSARLARFLDISPDSEEMARLEWVGLFSDRPIESRKSSPLDIFLNRMQALMMYRPGERDLVALQHVFHVAYPDGSREEIRSSLVKTGEPWGDTAMSRTVSLPAAIATRLILDEGVMAEGVQVPVLREIYEPVLKELETYGIRMEETRVKTFRSPLDT
ncbi:MAG TPA: saccharopine dehydrogenase C-terminal domain-containing protein [Thermoanaerobaculia bacterium]|nr:saccharopine dehydrogenase C-terminal domain-containing protein [Thermoanaerobaculia bacterium]HUM29616.1 saccharopine dehydrogenase C-terminal domain-containing protein [Thermoanaerobaculia bacterium]HXK67267.1 saccharopine dehydrogenase C-terminal domain-containing protein [Thermoanaerobaculia bacterium]